MNAIALNRGNEGMRAVAYGYQMRCGVNKPLNYQAFESETGFPAPRRSRIRARASFTLIELLVVLVIISVLVTITFSISKYAAWRARDAQARVQIEKIKAALEAYRADYGEYPVTVSPGNARHYSSSYNPNSLYAYGGTNVMPWTNINLASNTVMDFSGGGFGAGNTRHDYSLTYPLTIAQIEKGKKPYMDFEIVPIMHLSYNMGPNISDYIETRKSPTGVLLTYLKTRPVLQAKAVDPLRGRQLHYESENGQFYKIGFFCISNSCNMFLDYDANICSNCNAKQW